MFITLDTAAAKSHENMSSPAPSRACDQCKTRKVRCNMLKPCATCIDKHFICSYENARKKRGPSGKRIEEIRRHQHRLSTASSSEAPGVITQSSPNMNTFERSENQDAQFERMPGQKMTDHEPTDVAQMESEDVEAEDFIFPSLPVESPTSTTLETFGSLPQQFLSSVDNWSNLWPTHVNEQTLLPWIDVYFKRLHPTIPILNRGNMYREMLSQKHRNDPQYGSMLLSLCAFAMEQPVQIHERAMKASRSAQARMLLEDCAKMRVSASFGEDPSIEMTLTSFFMFACLFGTGEHKAARHRLREAVDLAYSLGLHLPQSYQVLDLEVREQWLRTYLVLSVTERAYALQQSHSISFRGRPGVTARFMQAFDTATTSGYIAALLDYDESRADAASMTGLLYLMDSFDAIDESIMDCWNGFCKLSDGVCESFDRRRALQMFRAQSRIRDACESGHISFAPSVNPLPLSELLDSQRADISITQLWLLNRLWKLSFQHGLLRSYSEHTELRYDYSCSIAQSMLSICNSLPLSALEVHGMGMLMKIHDIAEGMITAIQSSPELQPDTILPLNSDDLGFSVISNTTGTSIRKLLDGITEIANNFRGGDNIYRGRLATLQASLDTFPTRPGVD